MRRTIGYGLVSTGIAIAALVAVWLSLHKPVSAAITATTPLPSAAQALSRDTVSRIIRYSYTLRNDTPRVLKDVEFRTYAPVLRTSIQHCCKVLEASHPYRLEVDERGNQVFHFRFEVLPPYATRLIQIRAELDMAETPNRVEPTEYGRFLQAERYVELAHPAIQQAAQRIKAETPLETARNAYAWAMANVRYAGYIREDRGALYTLTEKAGDCTEYMYLFIALARANGIPARGVAGYVVARDAVLRPEDYHNWAEFYLDGAWQLADPQRHNFMENEGRYIALRLIDGADSRADSSRRFWYSGDGLRVRMN